MDMKNLAAAAILAFAASGSSALGQVYGGEDDPYQQNPYASNSYVPPPPEPAAPPAPAPSSTAAATPQQNAATPPQKAAASGDPAKK
jgi:hypothetical protein